MARLSVVVPFHNAGDYIGAALTSLARQTFADSGVVLVDDGCTDRGTTIAKEFVAGTLGIEGWGSHPPPADAAVMATRAKGGMPTAGARGACELSPNAYSTAIFRKAFGYDGETPENGYPRNDLRLRRTHAIAGEGSK